MTLKEIARQANVSVSTVSRVINQKNTKAASPEVQERIWKIVRKSGLYSQCNSPKPQIRTKSSNSEYNAQIHCLYLCKK